MGKKKTKKKQLHDRLILFRSVTILLIAAFLYKEGFVTGGDSVGLFLFALSPALCITALLDNYIKKLAEATQKYTLF
jgi:hypothetical protein